MFGEGGADMGWQYLLGPPRGVLQMNFCSLGTANCFGSFMPRDKGLRRFLPFSFGIGREQKRDLGTGVFLGLTKGLAAVL